MSSRSVSWRRLCSEIVSQRIDEALQSVIYIIHQTGPTGFVLKQGENKYKAFLGDVHTCTCSVFKKEKELCIHILWLLLKKFRIPRTNAVIHQLGLVEREINEVLHGYLIRQSPSAANTVAPVPSSGSCHQRPITVDDVCPICQNDLLGKPQRLSYCKYGCGKSVHLKCIKMWAEHQKSQGGTLIHCPLCREKFSTFEELRKEVYRSNRTQSTTGTVKQALHYGVTCTQCQVCPIAGKCYKCTTCTDPNIFLCHSCFKTGHHSDHLFQFQQYPGTLWRPAVRVETPLQQNVSQTSESSTTQEISLPQSFINDLQSRELNANDYELLLQLDQPPPASPAATPPVHVNRRSRHFINSFRTEPLDHNNPLLITRASCYICSEFFQRGDWIRKLPCKHKFHRSCIDTLLNEGHSNCPIDGKNLFDLSPQRQIPHQMGTRRTGHLYSGRHDSTSTSPLLREATVDMMSMSISGQGLTVRPNERNYSFRPPKNITQQTRSSLASIRRGSALQRTSPSIQNTSYINLHVTPLSSYRQLTHEPSSSNPSNKRPNYSERWCKSSTAVRQVVNGRTPRRINETDRRLLPHITPSRVEMNSLLHVSSLSTSLPPII